MKYPSVFRQLHATRCPVQKPGADIFFQLPDRCRGPSLLNAEAIGCVGEAPHFRDRYENEDGLEILHFRASVLFTAKVTVSSISRRLSYLRDTVSLDIGDPHQESDKCPKL